MSDDELKLTSNSYFECEVSDIPIRETSTTRLVLRSRLVRNANVPDESVSTCLRHQKKASPSTPWQDVDAFKLGSLKSQEEVRLDLDSAATMRLFRKLEELFAIGYQDWPFESLRRSLRVVDTSETLIVSGQERQTLEALLEIDGDGFWEHLDELKPGLIEAVARKRQFEERRFALEEFETNIDNPDWNEPRWQRFFQENMWIFGHNLAYQFLGEIQSQPHFGGTTMTGIGAQRGDFILTTEASAKFTVLVDIKRPNTPLVGKPYQAEEQYRNHVHYIGEELAAGSAQLQSYCRTWVLDGSQQEHNEDILRELGIDTYEPKGILVIGNLAQLDSRDKRSTFELYRRNMHNPEVITYDELLARAQFTISLEDLDDR